MTDNIALPLYDKSSWTVILFYSFFLIGRPEFTFLSKSNPVVIPPDGKKDL